MAVAVGFPRYPDVYRADDRPEAAPSSACDGHATRRASGGPRGGPHQAGVLPHAEALVRDASPRGRLRHSNRPGVAGTPRCQDHDDLHARPEPGTRECALAAGWTGEGGRSASAEAGGTWRAIPCRGSQANTHGASVVERREATGMTRRAPVVELGVLGIGLHAWSGFGRYTELSNSRWAA